MWRNYLLIAWRNLRKNKVFSLINILGLAFGLTCFLLIAMWVQDELSYDRFHRNAARMYRLNLSLTWPENQLLSEGAPLPLGPALQANLPGIRTCVRTSEPRQLLLKYGDKKLYAKKVLSVDSTFLDVFTFPVLFRRRQNLPLRHQRIGTDPGPCRKAIRQCRPGRGPGGAGAGRRPAHRYGRPRKHSCQFAPAIRRPGSHAGLCQLRGRSK
jgi:hypothetical protein